MADYLSKFWHTVPWASLGPFIGAIATVIAATLGALVVIWQNAKQARRATAQLRQTEAIKLKMRVYEEIVGLCRGAGDAEVDYSSYVSAFTTDLKLYRDMTGVGLNWNPPKGRLRTLQEKQEQFSSAVIAMIMLTERWGVLHPGLAMFRCAFNVAHHDALSAFGPYRDLAMRNMPLENPSIPQQPVLFPWALPNDETIQRIEVAANALTKAIGSFGGFIYDFQIDMQNLLLGELFEHQIAGREPLDPGVVVARLDDWAKLKDHFETNTPWGREKIEIEERVRKSYAPAK
ncbi:hypothetical protein [Rhizobium leguminosarum]|uniref:hypothetical protein n=1 Tax=Rhizobium leguminosarum TaxID=384 RepID=UPI001C973D96|nr:hypothetical protein [Rhizobium leguminosarum]MBY5658300.1 hypothetical protein [Rhizobium leguminosarum]